MYYTICCCTNACLSTLNFHPGRDKFTFEPLYIMIFRPVFSILWRCFSALLSAIYNRRSGVFSNKSLPNFVGQEWQTDGWEEFSIAVIPTTAQAVGKNQTTNTSSDVSDVFDDMQPVFKKAKKVWDSVLYIRL